MPAIGVLDLQGGVAEHLGHLARLGVPAVRVKKAEDFASLVGLIIPGGESTCLSRLLRIYHLDRVIQERFAAGLKLWGTCAGAILLAQQIIGEPAHLALMDITLKRNAFGSQLDSFHTKAKIQQIANEALPLVFIRAPQITRLGAGVECLLTVDAYCAAAEDTDILVTVFHPELTASTACHRYFAAKCGIMAQANNAVLGYPEDWVRYTKIP
jgi:5'-phosphate synthase pdxT subunit